MTDTKPNPYDLAGARKYAAKRKPFREDDVRRNGLSPEIFGILHDLAWSHVGQREWKWESLIKRAQDELRRNS
jgi:hypothetical protein